MHEVSLAINGKNDLWEIKFLWKMSTEEIIDMLPSEFDKYKI